jgi:hypothetical protein
LNITKRFTTGRVLIAGDCTLAHDLDAAAYFRPCPRKQPASYLFVMRARTLIALSFVAVASLAACTKNSSVSAGSGTNYSTSGNCVDNCGNDAKCQASCQDTSNQNPPIGASR